MLKAGGQTVGSWRGGYTNLMPAGVFEASWNQAIPALGALVGDNVFSLIAEDVTPSPYNQPPYLPSGDTDADDCTIAGVAP